MDGKQKALSATKLRKQLTDKLKQHNVANGCKEFVDRAMAILRPPRSIQDYINKAAKLVNALHNSSPCRRALYEAQTTAKQTKKLPHQAVETRFVGSN